MPLIGENEPEVILLKTLEPAPEPVFGDLYLEVHEEKWETYLVLEVDGKAWPDGAGCLKAGLDADVEKKYRKTHGKNWKQSLLADLGSAIAEYEKVRNRLDDLLEQAAVKKPKSGREKLLAGLPGDLIKKEARLREKAEAFLGSHFLTPGDVACLPPGVLHSLRHGMKVVEFQTPTYERLIAMFSQRVVTQDHWDTERALEVMDKAPYHPAHPPENPSVQEGVARHMIVDFPQFSVMKLHLDPDIERRKHSEGEGDYRLLFVTEGKGTLLLPDGTGVTMEREDGFLLPAALNEFTIVAHQGLTYLVAYPKVGDSHAEA